MFYFHGLYSKVACQSQIYSIFSNHRYRILTQRSLLPLLLLLILSSCSEEPEQPQDNASATVSDTEAVLSTGCKSCHTVELDAAHDLDCTVCHGGSNDTPSKELAHKDMILRPAHPDNMIQVCGKCHQGQVESTAHSLHFTLKKKVNRVRSAFGAEEDLPSLNDIPVTDSPETILELADDLLRRRCLRCHPYFSGDRYPAVVRGTGCASCHLEFYEGKLVSHSFLKTPGDSQCLQCHYGNWVGYDYYGRYEHDMNDEYRTPYTTSYDYFRPFGVEFHQLSPDIHQQKGMVCVDCHAGKELMGADSVNSVKISCAACHDTEKINRQVPLSNIRKIEDGSYSLLSAGDGKDHIIPQLKHPAHKKYGQTVGCQVCHAQWSFNDHETHLLRSDLDEYEDFSRLSVQGSFEVEQIIKNNLDFEADEMPHTMTDKLNGEAKEGLWYKGYKTRRWENVIIGYDEAGRLQVMRPLLDIYLSWIDEDETVRFDSMRSNAENNGLTPYVPHTTGKAGMFYMERIERGQRTKNDPVK